MKDRVEFAETIDRFDRRIGKLRQAVQLPYMPPRELLIQALEDLAGSLEELRGAEDEVEKETRELADARTRSDGERQLYRDLFWTAPHGYILTDDSGMICECNLAAAELFGDEASRLIGTPLQLLVAAPDRPRFRSWVQAMALDSEASDVGEFLMHSTANDRLFPCRIASGRTSFRDAARRGRDPSLRWSLVDLTDQKRARERDWFEEQAARKDRFLAVLSHELRNPLAAISLASQLMETDLPGDQGPMAGKLAWSAHIIRRHAAHLTRLVDDLLDVSRVWHGKVPLECSDVDLGEVVASAVENAQPLMGQKQHTLQVHGHAEPLPIFGDPVRLQQVIASLLDNAAKYTPAGGRIEVRLRRFGDRAAVSVRDFGVGIAPDRIDRIFELFEQAGPPSTSGLGVGLTLARELVKMHGGAIEARSEGTDHGSEFLVTLPLRTPAGGEGVPAPAPGGEGVVAGPAEDDVEEVPPPAPGGEDGMPAPAPGGGEGVLAPAPGGGEGVLVPAPGGEDGVLAPAPGGEDGLLAPAPGGESGVLAPAGLSAGRSGSARVQSAGDPLRVLVVDDNRDAAEMLGMSLEQLGHQVTVAFSAETALERAHGALVALVDLAMPVMDGFELAQRLRRFVPELRLIAVTGFGDEHNRAAAERAGFDRYLVKPVNVLELDAILRQR